MEMQSCETCLFARPDHAGRVSCHKKAPTNVAYSIQNQNQPPKIIVETMWPFVKLNDWCGAWLINRVELRKIPDPTAPNEIVRPNE